MEETQKKNIVKNFKIADIPLLRIKNNLNMTNLSDTETKTHLKKLLQSTPLDEIIPKGKNYYFKNLKMNATVMMNTQSLSIISADFIVKNA